MNSYQKKYIEKYSTVIPQFVEEVTKDNLNLNGLVAPHVPMCGPSYGDGFTKVAIIGEETRGWGDLDKFLEDANYDINLFIQRLDWIFKSYKFTGWTNNFGKTFWDTSFKILASINGEDNWKNLKNKNRKDILDSVLWCNVNSIEGYKVTAKKQNADFASWEAVKKQSTITLDRFELIEEVFSPDITIIMNWDVPKNYLHIKWESIENHLEVGRTEKGSVIYRMAHPSWLNKNGEYDSVLKALFERVKAV